MSRSTLLKEVGWYVFFLICLVYAAYAFYMGIVEGLSQLGLAVDAPHRAVPIIFIIHALAGGIVLITGSLQFNRHLLKKRRNFHRFLGRVYVAAIWFSSIGGLWSAVFFEVSLAAKIVLGVLSVLWFSTTTIALLRALQRDIAAHREWMIRSFSLSLFFVSFSFWVPGLNGTSLPEAVSYPLAVFLSWSLNLIIAEIWIRRTRPLSRRLSANRNRNYGLSSAKS